MRAMASFVHTVVIVDSFRPIDTQAELNVPLLQEFAPGIIDQAAIGLEGM